MTTCHMASRQQLKSAQAQAQSQPHHLVHIIIRICGTYCKAQPAPKENQTSISRHSTLYQRPCHAVPRHAIAYHIAYDSKPAFFVVTFDI